MKLFDDLSGKRNMAIASKATKRDRWILTFTILYLSSNYILPTWVILYPSYHFIIYIGRFFGFLMVVITIGDRRFRALLFQEKYILYFITGITIVFSSALLAQSSELGDTAKRLYDLVSCMLLYIVFMGLSVHEKRAKVLMWTFAILAMGNACVGLYGSWTGEALFSVTREAVGVGTFGYDPTTGRSGGIRGENYVGIWNAPALAFGIALLMKGASWRLQAAGVFSVLLATSSIVVSLSRGSAVSGMVTIVIGFILFSRHIQFRKVIAISLLTCLAFMFTQSLLTKQTQFFSRYVAQDMHRRWQVQEILASDRLLIWREHLSIIAKSPVFGHGPGYIRKSMDRGVRVPHNLFLDVGVEHGIIGILAYLAPFLLAFKSLVRYLKKRELTDNYGRAMCATFWGMTAGLFFLSNPYLKLLWMIAGYLEGRTLSMKSTSNKVQNNFLSPGRNK